MVTAQEFAFLQMDIVEFLETAPVSYNGLFSYGLIEHLNADTISNLFRVMGQHCPSGTEAVFATHNPSSIQAITRPLFGELSHERLYSQELLGFLFESNGFEIRETGPLMQLEKLISDKALTVDENERFMKRLEDFQKHGKTFPGRTEIQYLAGRVQVLELVLTEIVSS
jgi:hypothetical protein